MNQLLDHSATDKSCNGSALLHCGITGFYEFAAALSKVYFEKDMKNFLRLNLMCVVNRVQAQWKQNAQPTIAM